MSPEILPVAVLLQLGQLTPIELPQTLAALNVVRLTLEPGTVLPPHPHPGPEIAIVQGGSGSIRTVEGPAAQLVRAGARSEATPEAPSEEVMFAAGDVVILPLGNVSDARAGDEGFTALILEFTTQAAEATPEA